jgi:hypothetical protein
MIFFFRRTMGDLEVETFGKLVSLSSVHRGGAWQFLSRELQDQLPREDIHHGKETWQGEENFKREKAIQF